MLTRIAVAWLASAAALFLVANVVPGFHVANVQSALFAALVVGFINGTLGALIKFFIFPLRILTLGLASLAVNVAMLFLATQLVPGFHIDGLIPAFIGSIALSVITWILRAVLPDGSSKKKD